MSCCSEKRKKMRADGEKRALINRLKRIEGQVRGLCAMVEEDAYCVDVLTQADAASAALSAFRRELLAEHIRTCAKSDIVCEREGAVDELVEIVSRMVK